MDLNMDIRNELDFHFLDLQDLDNNDKDQLISILKPKVITKALKLPWNIIENNNNSVSMQQIAEMAPNYWWNDMSMAYLYSERMPTTMYPDWQTVYNVLNGNIVPNSHVPSTFMPDMTYPRSGYNLEANMAYVRKNGHRNDRNKIKRDNYDHTNNPVNGMQPTFIADQLQSQVPVMYIYPDPSISPPHQIPGQVYYPASIYSSIFHQHTNAVLPGYLMGQPPLKNGFLEQPESVTNHSQSNQVYTSSHDKCVGNGSLPTEPIHDQTIQTQKNNSEIKKENIINTVVVNNSKVESSVENINSSTANGKKDDDEKVSANIQIEQNLTSSINKNCHGFEKNDIVPKEMSNSIKVQQNGETDKKFKEEAISDIKTTIPNVMSKSVSKTATNVAENEDKLALTLVNTSITKPVTESGNLVPTSVSETSSTVPKMSWANVLKKGGTNSAQQNNIIPVSNRNGSLKVPIQEGSTIINSVSANCSNIVNGYKNDESRDHYDDPTIVIIGEFLSNYEMSKQTVSLLPRGLTNRSNYCYIHSILQCLLACPPFYNLLMDLSRLKGSSKAPTMPLINNMIKFVREFKPLEESARCPRKERVNKQKEKVTNIQTGSAFEPSYIHTILQHSSAANIFPVEGRQEDAEEFLSYLLNGINDEMLESMKLVRTVIDMYNINDDPGEEEWKVIGPKNKGSVTKCTELGKTPLSNIFRGQLRSRVSRAGQQPTDNIQPFFTLQLDIKKAESVKNALEILVGKDRLEGMTCSRTNQQIEAWKQVTLEELPIVLILHLKWFDYKPNGCSKILKTVEFPIDLKIDGNILSPSTAKKLSPKQKQYKLFAVTYHDGKEASKGHYVTDAFHVGYGCWVRYDDGSLKSISEHNVLNPSLPRVPYLLYYRRCDTIGNHNLSNGKSH